MACTNPDECKKICDSFVGCSNIAYPLLVINLLPAGIFRELKGDRLGGGEEVV